MRHVRSVLELPGPTHIMRDPGCLLRFERLGGLGAHFRLWSWSDSGLSRLQEFSRLSGFLPWNLHNRISRALHRLGAIQHMLRIPSL